MTIHATTSLIPTGTHVGNRVSGFRTGSAPGNRFLDFSVDTICDAFAREASMRRLIDRQLRDNARGAAFRSRAPRISSDNGFAALGANGDVENVRDRSGSC
jgi:hypothetical protein